MASSLSDFRYQCTPCVAGRVRAPILARRLADMARPAKGLQVLRIPRVAARAQRDDVIALVPVPPALPAAPAVAVEHGPPHPSPSAPVKCVVVLGAAPGHLKGLFASGKSAKFDRRCAALSRNEP